MQPAFGSIRAESYLRSSIIYEGRMLRKVLFLALLGFVVAEKATFEKYKVFRITPTTNQQLAVLRQLEYVQEYTYWHEPSHVGHSADLMVAPGQISEFAELMNKTSTKYEIYVANVQKLIDRENPKTRSSSFGWAEYHTLKEIYSWMHSLAVQYPGKVQVVTGGSTYEGRQIKGVKLSFGDNKPGIFLEGGIHAREWISPATVTYLINELLTSKDPEIRKLAEAHDWYAFPVVNPDGYEYTWVSNRLWRRTRSDQALLCKGVDANRNWGYKWMTGGASPLPCLDNYAGKSAFSEIETKSLSEYLLSLQGKIFAYIAFHSYSQLLMFPYGHTKDHLDNHDESQSIGEKAIEALAQRYGTQYKTGNIAETIYIATGSSTDWVKATLKVPLSFVYELRDNGKNGFLLPAEQIIPNGQEIVDSFLAMFKEATRFGYPKPIQP